MTDMVGRGYGRTTLMLAEARRLAMEGRAVYVVATDHRHAENLKRMFGEDANRLGVKFETPTSMPGWERPELSGAHPNCVVLADHYVVERENVRLRARVAELEAERWDVARECIIEYAWPITQEPPNNLLRSMMEKAIATVKARREKP